jgi:hypothetical protein
MSVSCECCVLLGRRICVKRVLPIMVCPSDREASIIRPWSTRGCCAKEEKKEILVQGSYVMY